MDNKALEIYYIRHADAESGPADGRDICDRDITPLGRKQLELLAERFKGVRIDAVFSSPLVRTVKTAAAVAEAVGGNIGIETVPGLIEKGSTPGYYGLPLTELKKYYSNISICSDVNCRLPGIGEETESKADCMERARAVIDYISNRFVPGQRVVIVSHGSFGISFYQAAMGITTDYGFRFTTDNTAVTKMRFEPDGVRRISFQNDVSHLIPEFPEYRFRM